MATKWALTYKRVLKQGVCDFILSFQRFFGGQKSWLEICTSLNMLPKVTPKEKRIANIIRIEKLGISLKLSDFIIYLILS